MYDVSPPISAELPVWPGDPRPRQRWLMRLEAGDACALSEWTLGSHVGAHVDATSHFLPGGSSLEDVPLGALIGACLVLDLTQAAGDLGAGDLDRALAGRSAQRVLLKTRNSQRAWERQPGFEAAYAGLAPDGAEYLVDRGVRLVGADYLSIESLASVEGGAPVHHRLLAAGVVVVEGLRLAGVPAAEYFLVALPLRLHGSEAAPARVVLLERADLAW